MKTMKDYLGEGFYNISSRSNSREETKNGFQLEFAELHTQTA